MRVVNFRREILFGIAHWLGIDPAQDLNVDHARQWTAFVNSNIRSAWELWDWPELNLTEERAFRQVWGAHSQYYRNAPINEPEEVYYAPNGTYYRVKVDAPTDPPIGTSPTNTTYWTPLVLSDLDRYLAIDQAGKQSIGRVLKIYNASPRTSVPTWSWPNTSSELGIDVSWLSGPTVWIKYQVRPSQFSSDEWDAGTTYLQGRIVMDPTTGHCYRSRRDDNQNKPFTSTASWVFQPVPYIFSEYLKFSAAADAAEDAGSASVFAAKAQAALEREMDKTVEQRPPIYYGLNGRCARVPLGLSGFWWSVPAPDTTVPLVA